MGIVEIDDVVAWESSSGILCDDCADREEDYPLTSYDICDDDIVICDKCNERIQ